MKLLLVFLVAAYLLCTSCDKKSDAGYISSSNGSYDCGLVTYWVNTVMGQDWVVFCPGPTIFTDKVDNVDSASYRNDSLLPKMRKIYKQAHLRTDITVVLWDFSPSGMQFVFKDAELSYNNF
jgi:hypothetical protein